MRGKCCRLEEIGTKGDANLICDFENCPLDIDEIQWINRYGECEYYLEMEK